MIKILKDGKIRFTFDHYSRKPVYLAGDFNNWDESSHPLHNSNGRWMIDLILAPGEYEFKYYCNGIWYNDYCAHKYVENAWGSDNSVVIVESAQSGKPISTVMMEKTSSSPTKKRYMHRRNYSNTHNPLSHPKKHSYN